MKKAITFDTLKHFYRLPSMDTHYFKSRIKQLLYKRHFTFTFLNMKYNPNVSGLQPTQIQTGPKHANYANASMQHMSTKSISPYVYLKVKTGLFFGIIIFVTSVS